MEERNICCCGASTWTKVIAWIEIVCSVILIVIFSVVAITIGGSEPDSGHDESFNNMLAVIMLILRAVVLFLMGIVLLRGSLKRKPGHIRAWLVITTIGLIVQVILETVNVVSGGEFVSLVVTALVIPFFIFLLWTVNIHKNEIMAAATA
ncbi:unnamed protein product [Allacma fusca]|uniref:Uncharacterized protein n=1 Tax=Allacma fusca TaxID=39272 RepID=A0A8J2KB30_9HEXA|nr:unnamed protein product [Allacma fusca]